MTLSITITPDEQTAAALEQIAAASQKTPAEVVLDIVTQHLPQQHATIDEARMKHVMAKIDAGETLEWDDFAGVLSSGLTDTSERFEDILKEELLRDD